MQRSDPAGVARSDLKVIYTGSSDGLLWDDPEGAGPLPGYDWSIENYNPDSWGQSFSITGLR